MREGERLTVPVLPLKNGVLFPSLLAPFAVQRPRSVAAVEAALGSEDKVLAVFPQKQPDQEDPALDDLHAVGTLGVIRTMAHVQDTIQILVQGTERIELVGLRSTDPYLEVVVRAAPVPPDESTETEALHRAVMDLAGRMSELVAAPARLSLAHIVADIEDPLHQAYLIANLLSLSPEQQQSLLSAATLHEALDRLHGFVSHEVQVLELRSRIASKAQSEIGKEQREYLLRQQMRAIQGELGEQSPEQAEAVALRRRLEEADLPDAIHKEVEKELGRLERTPSAAPDYQVTRTWVELALELPWRRTTEDMLDLDNARRILDEDHFDLDEVKDRIIEHLAVMKLNPDAKAPILCFVGPPGTGKTSVGQSIARALGRHFERMSLGGLHDEAELRGHRRTYIGAMPGRILRAIRRAGVRNPLLMLDEIDKLGRDFRGDPAAALMEILDPAQNVAFHDNYLDLPFDLSKVFFITTANTLDPVPRPVLDRMEILRLAGYSDEEKTHIARRYLFGRQIREAGLTAEQLVLPDETLAYLIRRYTREAGVRELERSLARLARKVATRVARGRTEPVTVRLADLTDLLGPERFFMEQIRRELAPGVAVGLAWTELGGEVLYVEAARLPAGKDLILTGHLGSVMQESARIAQSLVWSRAPLLGVDRAAFREGGLHIHVPAGAIPKDGPSAGITMAAALASLYTERPVRSDTAMTGEITLSGLVLPVGGIKEKVLAAHRAGLARIIIPKENEKDLRELPSHVREALTFVPVEHLEEVLLDAIPDLRPRLAEARLA